MVFSKIFLTIINFFRNLDKFELLTKQNIRSLFENSCKFNDCFFNSLNNKVLTVVKFKLYVHFRKFLNFFRVFRSPLKKNFFKKAV